MTVFCDKVTRNSSKDDNGPDSMTHRWTNAKSKILSLVAGMSSKAGTGQGQGLIRGVWAQYCKEFSSASLNLLEQMKVT